MRPIVLVLPLAIVTSTCTATAQSGFAPDLSLTTIVSGLSHSTSSEVAIDGAGDIWYASGGALTRIGPGGAVTPTAFVGRGLLRGLDGNLYFAGSNGPLTTTLVQVDALGQSTTLGTWSGFTTFGLAQDGAGTFYFGTDGGILALPVGAVTPSPFSNVVAERLTVDDAGVVFAVEGDQIVEILGPGSTFTVYQLPPGGGPFFQTMDDLEIGFDGQLVAFTSGADGLGGTSSLLAVDPQGATGAIAGFTIFTLGGPGGYDESRPSIGRTAGGDHYVLSAGTLYHLTGTPLALTTGTTPSGVLRLTVAGPPGSPLLVAFDVPGSGFSIAGVGTFHTSLGLLPTFGVLVDGISPLSSGTTPPWSVTAPLPPAPLGLSFQVEAYALGPAAANGWLHISNALLVAL